MPTVLSTKKLAKNQKELLLNSGIGFVEYDAIKIEFLDFKLEKPRIKNVIFSSKNSVKAIANRDLDITNCFCVGEKTSTYLRQLGFSIAVSANNSTQLAESIVENYKNEAFIFFCGNQRRDELPEIINKNTIPLKEIEVYKTVPNPKKIEGDFDGILFFSPSAVKSFMQKNKLNTTAFCIGKTTANEAKKYTENIIIANKPGIENVILQVVHKLNPND